MKVSYKVIDYFGNTVQKLEPYVAIPVGVESVEFRPNIGDSEDPNDVDELVVTVRISDPNG